MRECWQRADSDIGTPGCKLGLGVFADLASKDELDLNWVADVKVIGNG